VSVARYAYLNARVSVFAERLLDLDEIQALVEGHVTRSDAVPPELAGDAAGAAVTGDFDQGHIAVLLRELTVLIRPLSGPARDLLAYWAHRFELANLKVIIRGKMTDQSEAVIQQDLLDMGSLERLPTAELLQTDSLEELLRRLDRTAYASITDQARRLLERGEALFALDAAIDRCYFAGLARRGNVVDGGGGQLLRALVGSVIDRINLVWLLRYRFAYNLPPAQAYYLLIPAGYRLTGDRLQQLAQRASFEDVIANLPGPFAGLLAGCRNSTEATLRLEFETWRIASDVLYHSAFNVARALAYMVLRERDLRRWRAIVRGRNLPAEPDMIRTALGLPLPGGEQLH
jgi:V/A-type H+-transporting ATPase subunit C